MSEEKHATEAIDVEKPNSASAPPASHRYAGSNRVLRYFAILRPQLWEADEWEKVAFVLHHAMTMKQPETAWDEVTDALAELIPEDREFWLRVQATWNDQFLSAMTAMFESRT